MVNWKSILIIKKYFFLSDFDKSSKNNMKNAYAKLENEIHIDHKKYSFLSDFDKSQINNMQNAIPVQSTDFCKFLFT